MKIGILGGGQLAQMLIESGKKLNLEFRVFDPAPDCCAASLAETLSADFADQSALRKFSDQLDAVTFEWENVPAESAKFLEKSVPRFFPSARALHTLQDRLTQKKLLDTLSISTSPYFEVKSAEDFAHLSGPSVLKLRRHGYDGKGQARIASREAAPKAWQDIGGKPAICEKLIDFERELSLVSVRNLAGEMRFYPLVENRHQNGILHLTLAPYLDATLQAQAESSARKIAEHLNYIGVFAIEFFQVGKNLLVNEIAPRVHNSGHWSIEGAACSQFENHLRAGMGLALGDTLAVGKSAMINLIGELPSREGLSALAQIGSVHIYGKSPRPGRKLGHVTLTAASESEREKKLKQASDAMLQTSAGPSP